MDAITLALLKALGGVKDSQVTASVNAWLDDHPEATTTVQDGAITRAKLAAALAASFAEDYSSEKTYPVIGTYVWHAGALYKNIVSITTAEAWTAAHWTAVVLGDDVTDLNSVAEYIFRNDTALNLYDDESGHIYNGYPKQSTGTYASSANARTIWFECEPETAYCVEKKAGKRFEVAYGTAIPDTNVPFEYRISDNTAEYITFKTSLTARYVGVFVWLSTADTDTFEDILTSIRVHKIEKINYTVTRPRTVLGSEMIADFSAMTATGGSTYSNDKWHLPENGGIETSLAVEGGKTYFINPSVDTSSVTISDFSTNEKINPLVFTLGDASLSIFANADANWLVCLTPTSSGTVPFSIACEGKLSLDMTGLSVKPVDEYQESAFYVNNLPFFAFRQNVSFGGGQGKMINAAEAAAQANIAIGYESQKDVDTGYANTAVGFYTQRNLRNGRANSAFGNGAQQRITTGMYNNAMGTVAQGYITSGCWNNAFGNEAQRDLTSGHNNTAMGRRAQSYITTGCMNVAIGSFAGFSRIHAGGTQGDHGTTTASFQTLIGGESIQGSTDPQDFATALGYRTMANEKALALGARSEATGEQSVAIGYNVKATGDHEIVIGDSDSSLVIAGKRITFNQDGTVTWTTVS